MDSPFYDPTGPDWPPLDIIAERGGRGGRPGGGGGVYLPPAGGGAPGAPAPTLLAFPPEFFPPLGATDFFIQGTAPGLVAPSGNVQIGSTFQAPNQSQAVIRDVNLGISSMTATTVCTWIIQINGAPAPGGWGQLTIQPRAAAFVSSSFLPESTCIRVPAGAVVKFFVNLSVSPNPCDVSGSLHGWFW